MIWSKAGTVSICKWKDHRVNYFSVEMVEVKNKRGQVREKPNVVREYNGGMAGIDRSNQMLSYYSGL